MILKEILCKNMDFNKINLIENYRIFTIQERALKYISDEDILICYYELLNCGVLDDKNNLNYSWNEIKKYVKENMPNYIKKLIIRH